MKFGNVRPFSSLLTFFKHICGLYLFIGTFATILAEKAVSKASFISVLVVFNLLTVKSSAANCLFIGKRRKFGCQYASLQKWCQMMHPRWWRHHYCCRGGCKVKCNKDGRYNLHKLTLCPLLNLCCFRFPAFVLDIWRNWKHWTKSEKLWITLA